MKILHYPHQHDGCTWYRHKLPLEGMRELGAELFEITPHLTDDELEAAVKAADVLFVRPSRGGLAGVYAQAKHLNPSIAIVADTDDDLFDISPLNNAYETMGQFEVQDGKGGWIWQHGRAKFDLRANWHRLVDYRWFLHEADVVTTTTARLRERLTQHNDVVAVLPNAINPEHFPHVTKPNDGKVRVVWAGGSSHYEDLMMVKPALKSLLERHPNLEVHIVGQRFGGFFKDMPDRLVYHRWVDPSGLGYLLSTIGADIGIAPLQDKPFNHAKSSIKYFEYSALGLATVASDTAPYSDDVEGSRGVLADPQQFETKLDELITDPIRRAEIAAKAQRWVLKHRTIQTVAKDWLEVCEAAAKAAKGGT